MPDVTNEYNDDVAQETSTNNQLFATGGKTNPVYGKGARGYGKQGGAQRGRVAHIQFREQNSGFAPAEDYRAAKFLPGRWQDLDRNGCPIVLEGGDIVGLAAVESDTGASMGEFVHQVMPANGGVKQNLIYTGAFDDEVAVDIDQVFDGGDGTGNFIGGDARVNGSGASTAFVSANKPLGYTPTNSNSTAWEDVYTNQKFEGQITIKTEWLAMYPISDVFMHGATLAPGVSAVSSVLGMGLESASRIARGFADVDVDTGASSVALRGIRAGDMVMPNPWLPGKLISVDDFVTLALVDTGAIGTALPSASADLYAHAMQQTVGRCFKRQPRATSNGAELSNHDIYGSTYKYMMTLPGLGLSGGASQGIEADQEAGRQFAHSIAPLVGGAATLDVVFINFEVR